MKNYHIYKILLVLITSMWANQVSAACCLNSHPGAKPNIQKPITNANETSVISNQGLIDKVKENSTVRVLVKLNIATQVESKIDKNIDQKTNLTLLQETVLNRMIDTNTELVIKYENNPYLVLDVDRNALSLLASLPIISAITEYLPTAVSLSSGLDLELQYLDIGGNTFNGYLTYYKNPHDPNGFYWALENYCSTSQAPNCLNDINKTPPNISVAILLPNSDIKLQGLELGGKSYFVYLQRVDNPLDSTKIYWKVDNYRVLN
jgi:hypothetical protein